MAVLLEISIKQHPHVLVEANKALFKVWLLF